MHERLFVISDIEMGRKDLLDDFSDDDMLVEFIGHIQKSGEKGNITLILNGDIFDFLKMPYKEAHPRHITEEISLWKTHEVFISHPKVFTALKKFLEHRGTKIFFVIGNHDADLAWPSVQEKIKEHLGASKNVSFGFWYKKPGLHFEHGHLYDPFFSINPANPIINYKNQNLLNTPFGTQICFSHLIDFKKSFPHEEKLFPKHLIFEFNLKLRKHKNRMVRDIIIKDMLINPVLHIKDPTRRNVPYFKLISHALRFGSKIMDNSMFLSGTIRSMFKKFPDNQLYILGHSHLMVEHNYKGKKVLVTDTWRDEYDINRNFEKKKKSYAEIDYIEEKIETAQIKVF